MMFDNGLRAYIARANKMPRLSAAEEKELAYRVRDQKDSEAAQRLVCSQLGYVIAIATKYRRYHVPLSELVSEGNVGLVRALEKFDPDREIRFVTYAAFWIRSQIVSCILKNWSVANSGVGALKSKTFFKLRRECARAKSMLGNGPEFEVEVAERTGLSRERVREMLYYLEAHDVSLDEPVSPGTSGTTRVDLMEGPEGASDAILDRRQSERHGRQLINSALGALDAREALVIKYRFLVPDDELLSLAEIGRRLGVSRERARQLEMRARRKLKGHLDRALKKTGLSADEVLTAA